MQMAYNHAKEMAIEHATCKLRSLFEVHEAADTDDMEDASKAYGLLLHACDLKVYQGNHVEVLTDKVRSNTLIPNYEPSHYTILSYRLIESSRITMTTLKFSQPYNRILLSLAISSSLHGSL